MSNSKKWHNLYEGFLDDAPGRNESWTEELCYLGKNKWLLRTHGTDFSGTEEGETFPEKKDTNGLLERIIELDGYDLEGKNAHDIVSSFFLPFFDIEQTQVIGSRTIRFRELAEKYKLKDCVDNINKIEMKLIADYFFDVFGVEIYPEAKALGYSEDDVENMNNQEAVELGFKIHKKRKERKEFLEPFRDTIDRWTYIFVYSKSLAKANKVSYSKASRNARLKLCAFIESYVISNHKMPSGIHILPSDDTYLNGQIIPACSLGTINFDELELTARSD